MPETIPSKIVTRLNRGDRVIVQTAGGGGHGDPARRDAAARAEDAADGKAGDIETKAPVSRETEERAMSTRRTAPQPLSAGPRRLAGTPHRDRSWSPRCRSSIRTTICGSGRAGATCSTSCWPTPTAATTSSRTVFVQCRSMHRAAGPEEFRPVGETEFVNGVAAMSASRRLRRRPRSAPASSATSTCALGEPSREVLEAHIRAGGGRFRGIRHITA